MGVSASLGLHSAWTTGRRGWNGGVRGLGTLLPNGDITVVTSSLGGLALAGFGRDLFEKIILTPRAKDVGFLFSAVVWNVEAWNSCKSLPVALTAFQVTGVGGLDVSGPSTLTYYPGQAQIYVATLPTQGDFTIANTCVWAFTGFTGADMTVYGTRITVFPHRPDWSRPWQESVAYLTEVMDAYDGTEQRRALRQIPRYGASFQVLSTTPLETAALENLLFGWQSKLFGVPWWPETALLLADVSPGATILPVDISDRPSFMDGGLVMVWSDYATWEAFSVLSLGIGTLVLASATTQPWKAGARVVPLRRGGLGDQGLGRPANWLTSGVFSFSCEAV